MTMFTRKVTINVENLTERSTFEFGGEYFEAGGWKDGRLQKIEDFAVLEFENKSSFEGVSGYVHYHNVDHSQTLVMAFSAPILTACCFTARAGDMLADCQSLFERVPDLARPGSGLRRAEGCSWETLELQDDCVVVRCIILPIDITVRLPEEFGLRLQKARWCRSTAADDEHHSMAEAYPTQRRGSGAIIERQVVIEIDNRSEETFVLDGEWFDSGHWAQKPVARIAKRTITRLPFKSDEIFHGVCGLVWFVNESGLDVYFSAVFSNPISGDGTFTAWTGACPPELIQEMYIAPSVGLEEGVQVPAGRGCAWNVIERGSTVHVRLVILQDLEPMNLLAYSNAQVQDVPAGQAQDAPAPTTQPPTTSDSTTMATTGGAAEEDAANDGAIARFMVSTRPRDALDGMGSGLKAAGASVLAASATIVAMPVVGAREEGVTGFFKGMVKGVAGAAVITVGGAAACATQVVRGVCNTPEAIQQAQAGKRWDTETGTWLDDSCNLRQEVLDAGNDSDGDASENGAEGVDAEGRPVRKVADTAFYDIIGVAPNANAVEIKKGYYKAALKAHPDKNPDDPEASQKFQALAQAYQVLSDPKLRDRYDTMGKDAVSDAALPSVDPAIFFSMLFGSEQFEKYIGKLYLAMQTDHIAKDLQKDLHKRQTADGDGENARDVIGDSIEREMHWSSDSKKDKRLKRQQKVREVRCAAHLCERLDRWVLGRDEAGFMASISKEACELVRVSFGGRLLRAIGGVYETAAEQFFISLRGNFSMESQVSSWRDSTHAAKVRVQAMSSVARSAFAVKKMHDVAGNQTEDDDQEQKEEAAKQTMTSLEDSLPVFLQTIWDVSAVDIENTLRNVCDKALKDVSVPWQIRHRRAVALLRLGRVFRDVGQVEHADLTQSHLAKQHLEEALYGAIKEKH